MSDTKTPRDLVHYAHQQFESASLYYGHGTDNPWDDACALVLDALDLSHDVSDSVLDTEIEPEKVAALTALVQRRIQENIPTPYLTRKAWFCGLEFFVDERVLIPRSPMAEWIMQGGEPWLEPEKVTRVLDLCTGSGCIAIACAYAFPNAVIDAVDLSAEAIEVAAVNVAKHRLGDRVNLLQGDLFTPVSEVKYDLIISNPPYVGSEEMKDLPKEYLHEPDMALRAGELGLSIVDTMLEEAPNYLKEEGVLLVEVGNTWQIMEEYYPDIPFTWMEFENGGDGVFLLQV